MAIRAGRRLTSLTPPLLSPCPPRCSPHDFLHYASQVGGHSPQGSIRHLRRRRCQSRRCWTQAAQHCRTGEVPTDARDVLTRPAPPPDVILSYGPGDHQVADLRLPASRQVGQQASRRGVPLVLFFHGGFWRAAYDRGHTGPLTAALAADGFAVCAPEYRRTGQPDGGWPGTFDDVAAAVDTLPRLAAATATSSSTQVACCSPGTPQEVILRSGRRPDTGCHRRPAGIRLHQDAMAWWPWPPLAILSPATSRDWGMAQRPSCLVPDRTAARTGTR